MLLNILFPLLMQAAQPADTISFYTVYYNHNKIFVIDEFNIQSREYILHPDTVDVDGFRFFSDSLRVVPFFCGGGPFAPHYIIRDSEDELLVYIPSVQYAKNTENETWHSVHVPLPVQYFLKAPDLPQTVKVNTKMEVYKDGKYTEEEYTICVLRFRI